MKVVKNIGRKNPLFARQWMGMLLGLGIAASVMAGELAVRNMGESVQVTVPAGMLCDTSKLHLVWDEVDRGEALGNWANRRDYEGEVSSTGGVYSISRVGVSAGCVACVLATDNVRLLDGWVKLGPHNSYVDTGIKGTEAYGIDIRFRHTGERSGNWASVMGSTIDNFTIGNRNSDPHQYYLRNRGEDKWSNNICFKVGSLGANNVPTAPSTVVMSNGCVWVNGSRQQKNLLSGSLGTDEKRVLIGSSSSSANSVDATSGRYSWAEWWGAKVFGSNGKALVDLRPALAGSSTAPTVGFYDLVSGKMFPVKGEGSFTSAWSGSVASLVPKTVAKAPVVFGKSAVWIGGGNVTNLADAANWDCRDANGELLAGALPDADTTVLVTGETTFNYPAGQVLECAALRLDDCRLGADCDWRGMGASIDATVDLNGHRLRVASLAGTGTITDSKRGELHFEVGAGQTVVNSTLTFDGKVKVVKSGLGTFMPGKANATHVGGYEVVAGWMKNNSSLKGQATCGAAGSWIVVRDGAGFDNNGFRGVAYSFEIAGRGPDGRGALVNNVDVGTDGQWWQQNHIGDLTLTDDALVGNRYNFGFSYSSNDQLHQLTLNGHTLTVNAGAQYLFRGVRSVGAGRVVVTRDEQGKGDVRRISFYGPASDLSTVALEVAAGARINVETKFPVGEFVNLLTNVTADADQPLVVLEKYVPGATESRKTVQLGNDSHGAITLDLSCLTGAFIASGAGKPCTFAFGTAVTVDLRGRTLTDGERVIAWSAKPDGVAFLPLVDGGESVALRVKGDGLYVDKAHEVYFWIGGESGRWEDGANWSRTPGGESVGAFPQADGDLAVVGGTVTLQCGEESGTVSGLVVEFANGERKVVGGSYRKNVELNVERPQAGVEIAAHDPVFLGRTGCSEYAWYRAGWNKSYASTPVSTEKSITPMAADYEHWFKFVGRDAEGVVLEQEFYFSKLPVCYLVSDDGAEPTKAKEEHTGWMRAQGNDEFKLQYDGAFSFKVRGNSTATFDKKSWKLKLDEKTKMFGIPKSKHWVMLANYNDMSQLRNKLAYDLANDIGSLGMRSTWVQCILNGKFNGTYLFCEHIRVDSKRVPVYDWESAGEDAAGAVAKANGFEKADKKALEAQMSEDFAWVTSGKVEYQGVEYDVASTWKDYSNDITGGYIFEFSAEYDEPTKFMTYSGRMEVKTMVNSPSTLYTNPEMVEWCKGFLQDYWDSVTSSERRSQAGAHYAELADVDSMTSGWLVREIFGDFDMRYRSCYAYKDRGGKLYMGPVWDFDWSSHSVTVPNESTTAWSEHARYSSNPADTIKYCMFKEWASDWYFCRKLWERYWQYRDRYREIYAEGGLIDQYTAYLAEACAANDARWPRNRTYAQDVTIQKEYHAARSAWLDQQFASVNTLVESLRHPSQTNQCDHDANATTTACTDALGNAVPAIPLDWVRQAGEGAEPALGYAEAATLQVAVTNTPSVWGKSTPLWQDYVAGTNPDPAASNAVFRIDRFDPTGGTLRWMPDLGSERVYEIWGCRDLAIGDWHSPTNALDRFFKVKVSLP